MGTGNMLGEELVGNVSCINKAFFKTFPNRGMQGKTILFGVGLLGYYTWPVYAARFFLYENASQDFINELMVNSINHVNNVLEYDV